MELSYKIWPLFLMLLLNACTLFGQYSIQGQLQDSERKYERIILEYIPSFKGLSSAQMKNVLNTAGIDSTGNFFIEGNDLPLEKGLYRLLLAKKGDGIGISTGLWKNYIFLVLNNESHLEISGCDDISQTFENCRVKGSKESAAIQDLSDELLASFKEDYKAFYKNKSELKKQLMERKHIDLLKNYCDTSQMLMASLMAFAHIKDIDSEYKKDPDFFTSFVQKMLKINPNTPYVIELKNDIASKQEIMLGKEKEFPFQIFTWLLLGLLVAMGGYIFKLKKKITDLEQIQSTPVPVVDKINALSKKEKEVYQYIIAGKSNKEIAALLYVEVTTVKSHISKIYQKLGVKSRKEAIDLRLK